MEGLVELICPMCGGDLQVTRDVDRFACGACGSELVLMSRGETVWAKPVVEAVGRIGTGTAKVASEHAIRRLRREIPELEAKVATQQAAFAGWDQAWAIHLRLVELDGESRRRRFGKVLIALIAAVPALLVFSWMMGNQLGLFLR